MRIPTDEMDRSAWRTRFVATLAATAVAASSFALRAHFGFDIADEGFLWYGVRQVMAGEIPIRDFMSYDIGRYYLSAAVMTVLGNDGIAALRTSLGLTQTFGVGLATYLVLKDDMCPRLPYGLAAAVIFTSWMLPLYKVIDLTISIALIAALAFALERPRPLRWLVAGMIIGIAAVGGRNHGLYGIAAAMGAIAYAYWGGNWRELSWAVAAGCIGVMIGYLPNLLALALVPGFAHAFWDSIAFHFEYAGTNLTLPIPWPWIVIGHPAPLAETSRAILLGLFFIALPLFSVCGLIYAIYLRNSSRRPSVFVAAALLAIPYTHYAYSRADLAHLALGIFPFLVALLTLPLAREGVRFVVAGLLLSASLFLTAPYHPGYLWGRQKNLPEISIDGDFLTVSSKTAAEIALLEQLASRYSCDGRTFLATPFWPGAYAVLHRKAPLWEIYALFSRSTSFQQAEIARIKAADPGFAVVVDWALDGREELRYARTHPLIDQFIRGYFRPIEQQGTPAHIHLYARGDPAEKCP